ncbi:MAG: hypothetical protein L0207_03480 [Chlamydiae bacterium]|nr:hypothetical protein [Chlamydiota bacterium]
MFNNISFLPTRETLQSFFTIDFSLKRENILNLAAKGIGFIIGAYLTHKFLKSRYCQPVLAPVKNSIHNFVGRVFGFTKKIEEIKGEKATIAGLNVTLSTENKENEKKIKKLEDKIIELTSEVKAITSSKEELQKTIETLSKDDEKVKDLTEKNNELIQTKERLVQKNNELVDKLDRLKLDKEKLEKTIAVKEEIIQNLTQQIEILQNNSIPDHMDMDMFKQIQAQISENPLLLQQIIPVALEQMKNMQENGNWNGICIEIKHIMDELFKYLKSKENIKTLPDLVTQIQNNNEELLKFKTQLNEKKEQHPEEYSLVYSKFDKLDRPVIVSILMSPTDWTQEVEIVFHEINAFFQYIKNMEDNIKNPMEAQVLLLKLLNDPQVKEKANFLQQTINKYPNGSKTISSWLTEEMKLSLKPFQITI